MVQPRFMSSNSKGSILFKVFSLGKAVLVALLEAVLTSKYPMKLSEGSEVVVVIANVKRMEKP